MKNKIVLLLLPVLCNLFVFAQKKDTLRWFIGHWKDNKTFIIDSNMTGGAGGGTAVIKGDGSIEVITPGNKAFDKKMNDQIAEIDKEEKDIDQQIRQDQGMYQYNFAKECDEELEKVKNDIKGYIVNPQDKKEPPTPEQQLASKLEQACKDQEADYHRIIDFAKNKSNRTGPFNLPPPPVADYFNCWGCDSAKQAEFDTLAEHYANDFFNEEAEKIKKLLGWLRQLDLLGHGETGYTSGFGNSAIDDLFQYSKDPAKKGACSYFSPSEMNDAVYSLVLRCVAKAEQLFRDNKTNYGALMPVIKIYLGALRQAALLGINDGGTDRVLQELGTSVKGLYDKLIDQLLKKKDYSLIGSIPFIIGLSREYILLTGNTQTGIDEDMPKLIGFTHFKLTIDMDVKLGKGGGYIIAHLKGTAAVVTELDRKQKTQCVKFVLANKEENNIKLDVIANEMSAPGPVPHYIGTKIYTSPMPVFKITFCPAEPDTFSFSRFMPKAPDRGMWQIPGGATAPMGINGLDGTFTNGRETANEAQEINPAADQAKLEDMKRKASELASQMQGADPKKRAELIKQMMETGDQGMQTSTVKLAMIKFPVHVNNMDTLLVKEEFNAKELNPDAAPGIIYGFFRIRLEHDPQK
jgi:hypothetical protein